MFKSNNRYRSSQPTFLLSGPLPKAMDGFNRTDLREQRGGIALIMLIAFMVLAVPIVLAALQVSDQLVRSSMVYDNRLVSGYAASSGIEVGIANLSEESFRDTLVPGEPPFVLPKLELNGKEITVSVSALPVIVGLNGGALIHPISII